MPVRTRHASEERRREGKRKPKRPRAFCSWHGPCFVCARWPHQGRPPNARPKEDHVPMSWFFPFFATGFSDWIYQFATQAYQALGKMLMLLTKALDGPEPGPKIATSRLVRRDRPPARTTAERASRPEA